MLETSNVFWTLLSRDVLVGRHCVQLYRTRFVPTHSYSANDDSDVNRSVPFTSLYAYRTGKQTQNG